MVKSLSIDLWRFQEVQEHETKVCVSKLKVWSKVDQSSSRFPFKLNGNRVVEPKPYCFSIALDRCTPDETTNVLWVRTIAPLVAAVKMYYLITTPLPTRQWPRCLLATMVGCAALAMLDGGQAPAFAQVFSPADLAPPIATTSIPTNSTAQAILLVDPTKGNDAVADGSDRAPFKTITQALQAAQAGTVIRLSPGTYSQETGETFPLHLKPEVTLQGDTETRGQGIVIQGSGFFLSPTFARQKVAIVGADRAMLIGVTVKNPDSQGYGIWIESTSPAILDSTFTESGHDGISVTGHGSPLIRNNYFYQNGANGITIYGTSQAEVRENIFEQTGFAINVNQKAAPLLIGNRITQNKDGIVVQANAQPIVRDNSVEGNQRDGLVAIAQSRPNLGTATAPGGNSFRNNGQFDVNAKGVRQAIPAFGNDLSKTIGTLDLAGTSLEAPASSASSMPWPSSTASRLPASADKSTSASGKSATRAAQKLTSGTPSLVAANPTSADTIPFGQRLVSDHAIAPHLPTTATQVLQRPPAAPLSATETSEPAGSEPGGIGVSAASFPIPMAQSVQAPRPAIAPLVPVVLSASGSSESAFPVPAALSGGTARSVTPRPVQVMRMAVTPSTPLPKASKSTPLLLPARVSAAVMVQTPALQPASAPIAVAYTPRATASLNRLALPILKPLGSKRTGSIDIPVPAPETRSTPVFTPVRSVVETPSMASVQSKTLTGAGLLPVPNPNAPIGVVGNTPNIYRSQQNDAGSAFASNRVASGLRYRVVVEADDSQQAQLRATFPNAFRTSIKGRSLMQVGAFGDRTKADQLMQTLHSQGVQAMVETLE